MGVNSDFIDNLVDELLEDMQEEQKDVCDEMFKAITYEELDDFMAQHEWQEDDFLAMIEDEDRYNQAKQDGTLVPEYPYSSSEQDYHTNNQVPFIVDGVLTLTL